MNETATEPGKRVDRPRARPSVIDPQLADQLLGRAQSEGIVFSPRIGRNLALSRP
jgi:hypothetical protein